MKLVNAFPRRNSLGGFSSRDSSDGIFILATDVTRSIESFNLSDTRARQWDGRGDGWSSVPFLSFPLLSFIVTATR